MSAERPRHIALFIYALTGGGAQRRTLELADGFAARGHRVDLVVVRRDAPLVQRLSHAVRLVSLDSGWGHSIALVRRTLGHRGLETIASIPALARYLLRERPDVLLSAASHVNLVSVLARHLSRSPVPLVLRASNHPTGNPALWPWAEWPARFFLRWMAGRVYPSADAIIAVSEGVADDLVRLTGMPPERIHTVYSPIVSAEFAGRAREPVHHPWLAPGGPPVVLGAGTLKIQKDFRTLIRAFARVREVRPARLVIVGEGHQRHRLEALARDLDVTDDVALVGYVSNALAWMARASVFVLSSAWEGLPGALIEAMACGCPVVSTDCPSGPAEILDDGTYGPLVPVGDDRALAEAILNVMEKPIASARLRARAAAFAVGTAVDRYLDVLREQIAWAEWGAAARLAQLEREPAEAGGTGSSSALPPSMR